ncbi:MAG: glycosyltransferase family 39 protein [Lachnospiraceae bacterium]|nr:glycosyltransferase family 39 protein [Lachnospiraceae bacterium]
MDEAFTATLVNTDMSGVISRSMHDTLPPLYNILLKLMTDAFGYSVPVMKIVSVLPMFFTLLLSATVVRKRHGLMTASVFMLSLTAMPLMLYFGLEIRMYSLGFFFATASGIYAYEVLCSSNRKNWILFTLFSVLAGYSHHFAFVTVGFVYLFLLLYYIMRDRTHIRRWLFCLLATFILYLPCMVITLKQMKRVSGYFSMPEITLSVFARYMLYPYITGTTVLSVLLGLAVAGLFLYRLILFLRARRQSRVSGTDVTDAKNDTAAESAADSLRHMYALFCLIPCYGVLLFGTAVSKVMTANIFVDRYLFFSCGLIWLFFAIEISSLTASLSGARSVICQFAVFLFIILIGISSYRIMWGQEYGADPSAMTAYLAQNVSDEDAVCAVSDTEALFWCLQFYKPGPAYYGSADDAIRDLSEGKIKTLWVAVDEGQSLPALPGQDYEAVAAGEFSFDRYHFTLFQMFGNKR